MRQIYRFDGARPPLLRESDLRAELERRVSPKRQQRAIHREVASGLPGTKAQQALQAQREQSKAERTIQSRRQREREGQRRYALRQQKRKEKRRGH